MRTFMIVHLIIALTSFYSHFICNKKYEKASENKTVTKSEDTCYINVLSDSDWKEYNCYIFIYIFKSKQILIDSNVDNTFFVNKVLHNSRMTAFNYYDSPTGRRKLLLFDLKEKEILLSGWFDDSAIGDSIDLQTINVAS